MKRSAGLAVSVHAYDVFVGACLTLLFHLAAGFGVWKSIGFAFLVLWILNVRDVREALLEEHRSSLRREATAVLVTAAMTKVLEKVQARHDQKGELH